MKRITVSIDEPTHHKARIKAAALGMSLSDLVRVLLVRLADQPLMNELPQLGAETPEVQQRRLIDAAIAEVHVRSREVRVNENLPKESLYDRNAVRSFDH